MSAAAAAGTDWKQLYATMKTRELATEAWATQTDIRARDALVESLMTRERVPKPDDGGADDAWPSAAVAARDEMAGLYPDPADPDFAARIYGKREFYEARAIAAGVAAGDIDPCSSSAAAAVFELTPVQRIVSRFLHPMTPYNGALLFHGVGVGKTCTAVTVAEQFLESAPQSKVIVLVPQALKDNFKATVFDPSKIRWDEAAGEWTSQQCTGTAYLERLGLMQERDLKKVIFKVEESRRARYVVTGYQAFANWLERTINKQMPGLSSLSPEARRAAEDEFLRREFSDHLIIIDEAHNLRDTVAEAADIGAKESAVTGEAAENAGGKALNPWLKRIVLNAEGLRLLLMTATPMYNSAPEIVLLLNYLLMNDTKSERLSLKTDIFTKTGELKPGAPTRMLEKVARRYVSYMRGENPYTFPLRMRPMDAPDLPADEWPEVSATKRPVEFVEGEREALNALPLIFTEPIPGSPPEQLLRAGTSRAIAAAASAPVLVEEGDIPPVAEEGSGPEETETDAVGKVSDAMLDQRMQMANISYPNMLYGGAGWDTYFNSVKVSGGKHKLRMFGPKPQEGGPFAVDTVFAGEGLRTHAPKLHRVVESIKKAQGICFAYSRYIKGGALPLAIALERAGFQRRLADGTLVPLLVNAQPPVAPICALCGERDGAGHGSLGPAGHPFRAACYVLLTSEDELSPNFKGLVRQAATWEEDPEWGPLGGRVKAVIGSQVASEGLDLKCVREMHVIDAWYHLNRTEQIIGRAIRYCSHTALRPIEERLGLPRMSMNNTLIYLHAMRVGAGAAGEPAFETADMYAYRLAIQKALMVGYVQRLLKKHAWDCNLELEAITFAGLPLRPQVDAQGNERRERNEAGEYLEGYSINDRDFTTYCDYMACEHQCARTVARTVEEGLHLDSSTFTVSDARRLILSKQEIVRRLFEDQVMVPETVVQEIFSDLPWEIAEEALMELIDGRRFRVKRPDGVEGFLVKKAGYLVFQPALVSDTDIPLAMRYARAFQLRRRFMDPSLPVLARAEEYDSATATAAQKKVMTSAAAAGGPALIAAGSAVAGGGYPKAFGAWATWYAYVRDNGSAGPASLPVPHRLWTWLLDRYKEIPEMRAIALRWWFDHQDYASQRSLLEFVATTTETSEEIAALQQILNRDVLIAKQMNAYRIYNPSTMAIEIYCQSAGAWGTCPSNVAALVDKQLGNTPVTYPAQTGSLFGFLSAKGEKIFFKTLDTTKTKKSSTVGAGCINVSNLGEHQPRVRLLHAAARELDTTIAPLMLPDDDAAGTADKTAALTPTHLEDMTLQPLCLYMEVLCRLLDARAVGGRRWFLDAVAAAHSGLKGRK